MNARHRSPDHPLIAAGVDRYLVWLQATLAGGNAVAVAAFTINRPGTSPAMLFLAAFAPLPVWALLPGTVAVLLAVGVLGYRTQVAAHTIGMFLWAAVTVGAVQGLVTQTTASPSASLLLTALLIAVTGWHAGALLFRRRLARLTS